MADSEVRRGGYGDSSPVREASAVGVVEESSPDALKNTPSNIAKLEGVIEHCTARQKYLAQTQSPSDGGDVRWYFCKVPLAVEELAASAPHTEIVGKGDYFRFGMRDSLAVEASFLQREEELLSLWWKEYAECSEGPLGRPSSSKNVDTKHTESSLAQALSEKSYEMEEERVGVPVKGGLYEVDLVRRHCFPVYWNGENRRVLRGHWFARKGGLDWLPLREDVAEQLEVAYRSQVWHRRRFQPSGLFAARVDLQGPSPGLHALFTGEDDTWEAWLHVDPSGFSSVIPLGVNGVKLRRGYSKSNSPKPTQDELRQQKEEDRDDYCSQVPVRHLVFMVHGIGQRLEKSNLVDDVGNFHHITESLAEQNLTSHQRSTQRVLYIPCQDNIALVYADLIRVLQWRKGLKLSGESAVEKITLDGVRGLRVMLGATVHDILYYMSPIYCQDIINSVSNQLNRLYLKFLKRNPGYDGKVSIYGHSLGSVLSYDILCHQEKLSSPFPMDWMYKEHAKDKKYATAMNDEASTNNSSHKQEDKRSSEIGEIGDMSPDNDYNSNAQPSFVTHKEDASEGNGDDVLTVTSPVSSNFDELTTEPVCPSQLGGKEYMHESVSNSEEMVPCEDNALDETTSTHCGVTMDEFGKMDEEVCVDDTNKMIESMQKEIDLLKAKLAKVESECRKGDGGLGLHQENEEVLATTVNNSISEKLSPEQDDSPKSYTLSIKYTKLEFKVDTFFAVGSPLGVFLALRNVRIGIGKGKDYWAEEKISNEEMPACRQMFNIFHPFDPVAYRIEPLVCKEYISKRPVIIPYHKGGKRLHIGYQEFTENLAARSQAIVDRLSAIRVKVLTVCESKKADSMDDEEEAEQEEERSYGSYMMERLTGSIEGRVDHMLQDETFRHAYLSAIGSHTNYWRDYDTALFILKHLYRDILEDPSSPEESDGGKPKTDRGSIGWSDRREGIEAELPLTFSDKSVARSFSNKAKKFLKRR